MRIYVALLPMIPGVFLAAGAIWAIFNLDELERKILLERMAISFMATLILVNNFGMLGVAGMEQLNGTIIGLVMAVLWVVGKGLAMKRYQ